MLVCLVFLREKISKGCIESGVLKIAHSFPELLRNGEALIDTSREVKSGKVDFMLKARGHL